jgi:hypothetical protein
MEVKRYDIYLVGLVVLHFVVFFRILSMITVGSALQMMSIENGFGYMMIAIFVAIFSLSFFNLSHMFRITTKPSGENSSAEVSQLHGTAQRFLIILLIYLFLECIQALHYMGEIGSV